MPTTNFHGITIRTSGTPLTGCFWLPWYLIWIGISLVCLVLGLGNYFQERDFLARAELDAGTITAYELHVRNDGKSEYCPRIEFTTKAGDPVAVQGSDCPNRPDKSKIGQQVQVYYDPKNPDSYEEKTAFTGYDGLIFGLIGAGFFGLFWVVPLVVAIVRRLTQGSAPPAQEQRNAAASEAATDARIRESLLAGGASEAEAEEHLQKRRRVVEQWKAKQERRKTEAESPAEAQARLAQLKQQEAELQRKIDERRQQGQ